MFSSHSYASKQQLLQWVSDLLRIQLDGLQDVRPFADPHRAATPQPSCTADSNTSTTISTCDVCQQIASVPAMCAPCPVFPCMLGSSPATHDEQACVLGPCIM